MSKRGTGVAFIAISALLISSKYISASIFGSGVVSWNKSLYEAMLGYVGNTLSNFSLLAFITGIAYIVWEEYEDWKNKNKNYNN
ncbi:hypothetical protein AWH56_011740 [Anaerobacillus isosaccharinicus]|uniref:Uncharacterized protein n=1 Tax=Anaerobacillus isosaccharinicus TaxID=1532552 RepID=A0A1S2LWE7_9BACI|nr:hypothetical protein [Anaerobacillus isosaccharinicus]MBA5588430.1 hypothetical protein [Anaerobacillus isosaccharinicus]QOY38142.1 hypothetical protein AWH56_011740 [Anaerobacillus isosaccharinicus]